MKPLSRLESLIGEILERPAWLLSQRRLHPLEITAALSRALEQRSLRLADRVLAPDRFVVRLHPETLATFAEAAPALEREFASYLAREVEERELTVTRPPEVILLADPAVKPARVEVVAEFSPAQQPGKGGSPKRTRVLSASEPPPRRATGFPAGLPPSPDGTPALAALDSAGRVVRTFPLRRFPANIGRRSDCEVPLQDSKVSRNHARIVRTPSGFAIFDLDSLNGTLLNQQHLTGEDPLVDGDELQIGRLRLRFFAGSATGG